jgi:hypothetical protein
MANRGAVPVSAVPEPWRFLPSRFMPFAVHAIRERLAAIDALHAVGKREANHPKDRPFCTRAGTAFHSTNVRRSFEDTTDLLGDVPVECRATRDFRPHVARGSAVIVVFPHRDASAANTIAMLDHSYRPTWHSSARPRRIFQ